MGRVPMNSSPHRPRFQAHHARGYTCCRSLYVLDCHCTSFSSTTGGGRSTSRTVAPECRSCRVGRHRCSSPPRDSTAQTPSPGAVLPSSRSWLPPRRNAATPGRRRQAGLSCLWRLGSSKQGGRRGCGRWEGRRGEAHKRRQPRRTQQTRSQTRIQTRRREQKRRQTSRGAGMRAAAGGRAGGGGSTRPGRRKGAEDGEANETGRAEGGTDKQRNRHDGSRWEGRIGGAHKMGADGQRAAGGGAGEVRQPGRPGHPLPSTPH